MTLAWFTAALAYRLLLPGPLDFSPARPRAQVGYILLAPQFAPFFFVGLTVYRLRTGQLARSGRSRSRRRWPHALGPCQFRARAGPVYGLFAYAAAAALWRAAGPLSRWPALALLAWPGVVFYSL